MSVFRLDGKTALVTGASRGIGEAVARHLAAQGARVVVAARSVDRLSALAAELGDAGHEVCPLELDVNRPGEVESSLKRLPAEFAAVDILVNNAGITADSLMLRMSFEDWERVIRTNLTGAFAVTRAVTKPMLRRRWGRIVSISSVVGLMGNAGQTNYAAAKAGLIGFTKSLARELAPKNITVNVIAPGYIRTAMTAELAAATRDELATSIPLRRLGEPADIAAAVGYLVSEEGGYVTGHVLNVSGGMYI